MNRHPWRIVATLILGYGAACTAAGIGVYALAGETARAVFMVAAVIGGTPFALWLRRRHPWNTP